MNNISYKKWEQPPIIKNLKPCKQTHALSLHQIEHCAVVSYLLSHPIE